MDFIGVLRQLRIGPFTIFDTVIAYVAIYLLAPLLTKLFSKIHIHIFRIGWLWLTLPIGVIFHLVLHINTPFMKMLLNPSGDYLAKIVLLFMLYMGLKNIRVSKQINNSSE